ncbi:MAG: ABC transporter permease [Candidatus Heimdallarchaeota archaeon]|nr:ABC transporter permease [Candidatus Heimdallarchaeota archaeon]
MRILNHRLFFQKRIEPITGINAILFRIAFLLFGLVVAGLIFLLNGVNPIITYIDMIRVNLLLIPNTIARFIPLLAIGLGLAIPFKARVDNIGAEGQYIIGMLTATGTAFLFPDLPGIILIPLMFVNAFILGAIWAIPVVLFRAKGGFQGADVVVSFLLVFPALYLMEWLVSDLWRDPETGFTYSSLLPENAQLPKIPGTPIYISIFLILAITLLVYYFLFRNIDGIPKLKLGYEINVMGKNPLAGRIAGMSFFRVILITMIFSGGMAAIAGVGEVAGNALRLGVKSQGYGYTGIAVAYLGGLNPLGIIVSALFFAALKVGGLALTGIPATVLQLFSGIIIFFVLLSEFFFRFTIKMRRES